MNLSEVNWDFNASGSWPLQIKVAAILIVCCLVAGGGGYYFTVDQLSELETLEQKESELKISFASKQKKAVNLPAYREQLKDIQERLVTVLKQMPTKAEVARLLTQISQIALESGLENRLFQPEAPLTKDIYIELPYKIEMLGKYEELGLFVSGLASLPRIVTVHDVQIKKEGESEQDRMKMTAVVKTYNESPK